MELFLKVWGVCMCVCARESVDLVQLGGCQKNLGGFFRS